jgi:ParB-like chromosome segregation protein Spo0J
MLIQPAPASPIPTVGSCCPPKQTVRVPAPAMALPVSALLPSDSPRLSGEDEEHVRLIAESVSTLPPIVVRRSTMRVIDGMHRLRAAGLRGEDRILVEIFDGTEEAAFVLAVELNAAHGLPLSRDERISAAARIIDSHPQWSDRRIAATTGLAASSVASVRASSTALDEQSKSRVGRDGRQRPLNPAEGRVRASHLVATQPSRTLQEIAEQAGISVATAKDVRDRVRAGKDPLPPRLRAAENQRAGGDSQSAPPASRSGEQQGPSLDDLRVAVARMIKDPSMHTNAGRALLQMLRAHAAGNDEQWHHLAASVPEHRAATMAQAAKVCAGQWLRLAELLETNCVDS